MSTNLINRQTGKVTGIDFNTMLDASKTMRARDITLNDEAGTKIQVSNLYNIEAVNNYSFLGNIDKTTTVLVDFTDLKKPTFTIFISTQVANERTEQNTDGRA